MIEVFADVMKNFLEFFNGNYTYIVLYVLALIVMVIWMKKKDVTKNLIWMSILLSIVIFCPITAKIIMVGLGDNVYWRMFWLYPFIPVISVALTLLVSKVKHKLLRFFAVGMCGVFILLAGNSVISKELFDRAENYEKTPQYVIEVCNMINEDAKEQNITDKKLATCSAFLLYVRQYDATLKMENSRENIRGFDDRENASMIFQYLCGQNESIDYDELAELLREENCSYIVLDMEYQTEMGSELVNRGFTPVGNYGQYYVYRDGFINLMEPIENNEVVSQFATSDSGYLIGQYASLTGDQSSFYTITDTKGHLIVIDGGWKGDSEYVRQVIDYFGGKVDAWIITHPHFDHVRAFNTLMASENCPEITTIYASEFDYDQYKEEAKNWDHFEDFEDFLSVTKDATNLEYLHAGDSLEICGLQVDVYHDYSTKDGGDACNDGSLVFEVTANQQSMLFCGDTGEEQSETIIENYGEQLSADYLQMGHHGNGGLNEEFYKLVSPSVAFFDAPEWLMNPEGETTYTTPENRELMESLGAKIYYFNTAPNYIILD
ncbi:MAG: MBL fold metallo-hydrolase [Lachnospiraceae bacterium]|nr:MBL fold metallo-hydrolase [Lachnospiraceae bacterium]